MSCTFGYRFSYDKDFYMRISKNLLKHNYIWSKMTIDHVIELIVSFFLDNIHSLGSSLMVKTFIQFSCDPSSLTSFTATNLIGRSLLRLTKEPLTFLSQSHVCALRCCHGNQGSALLLLFGDLWELWLGRCFASDTKAWRSALTWDLWIVGSGQIVPHIAWLSAMY